MAANTLPTPDTLRQLLDYYPDSGMLVWRTRGEEWFSSGLRSATWRARNWNAKHAGCSAGYIAPNGYRLVQMPGRMELGHRIVWAMVHGEWPDHIDHIDGDRANNRISNLRNVAKSENNRNMARSSRNSSGVTGVSWSRREGKWVAEISHNAKKVSLGRFAFLQDAVVARQAAEIKYGYHQNHGRAA